MNRDHNFENKTRDKTDKRLKNLVENNNSNAPPFCSLNTINGFLTQNNNNNRLIEKIKN